MIATLQKNKDDVKNTFISRQSFLSDADALKQWDNAWDVAKKAVTVTLTSYNNYATSEDDLYNQAWNQVNSMLDSYSSQYTYNRSDYIPAPQTVKIDVPPMPVVCTFNANTSFSGSEGYTPGSGMCQ